MHDKEPTRSERGKGLQQQHQVSGKTFSLVLLLFANSLKLLGVLLSQSQAKAYYLRYFCPRSPGRLPGRQWGSFVGR